MGEESMHLIGLWKLAIALFANRLGASGGELLVPPRKKERMRLKGGAVGKADDFIERLPPAIVR